MNKEPIPQDEYEKACVVVVLPSRLLFIHLLLVYLCVCVLSTLIHNYVRLERREIRGTEAGQVGPTHTERETESAHLHCTTRS